MGLVSPLNHDNTSVCLFGTIVNNIRLELFQDLDYLHHLAQYFVHSRYLTGVFYIEHSLEQR